MVKEENECKIIFIIFLVHKNIGKERKKKRKKERKKERKFIKSYYVYTLYLFITA